MLTLSLSPSDLEWLKVGLSFLGGLLGAVVGGPILESFKDRIGARRSWKTQRKEIIETVRMIYAQFDSIDRVLSQCIGDLAGPKTAPIYLAILRELPVSMMQEAARKLSALAPGQSERSGVAQALVTRLLILSALLKQMQQQDSGLSSNVVDIWKYKSREARIFIASAYAPKFGIESMNLLIDEDVANAESRYREHLLNEIEANYHAISARAEALSRKDEENPPTNGS